MPKIIANDKGFKVLELNSREFLATGGFSICDGCCKVMFKGYFIAVLNRSYCEDDFKDWLANAIRYNEDIPYENQKFNQMKTFLEKIELK